MRIQIRSFFWAILVCVLILIVSAFADAAGVLGKAVNDIIHHRGGLQYIILLLATYSSVYTVVSIYRRCPRSRAIQSTLLGIAYGIAFLSFGLGMRALAGHAKNEVITSRADFVKALFIIIDPLLLCFICSSVCLFDLLRSIFRRPVLG